MDPFAIQRAVKENAEDRTMYLRDLKNWVVDIKKIDDGLRGIDHENEKLYPEIRSKAQKDDAERNMGSTKSPKKKKFSAYDYESWDKLDVDEVAKEIDLNEEKKMKETALYEKEMGNSHVKTGNWDKAISCYSKAIKVYPKDAIFFANRALCYLKLKNFQKAELDCSKAISLDSSYVKAWLRRSAAWEGLGNLKNSKRDLERVLKLEPRNSEAVSKLAALEKKTKGKEYQQITEKAGGDGIANSGKEVHSEGKNVNFEKQKDSSITCDEKGQFDGDLPWKDYRGEIIQSINKPPHLRSKKPLRRVHVDEEVQKESDHLGGTGESALGTVATAWSNESCIQRITSQEKLETSEPPPPQLPPPPKSSVQFFMNWKRFKMYPDMALMYLEKIPPESLPLVFGDSLEISVLEEMINILGQKFDKNNTVVRPASQVEHSTYAFLKHLSNVPRFSTLAMFLNTEEQTVFRKILTHCVENGECTSEESADIAGKFML